MNHFKMALIFAAVAGACSPKEKIVYKYITIVKDGATETPTTGKSDVVMSGALVIGASGTALSLTTPVYSLFCVTFEDAPIGFAIATEKDGTKYTFNQKLEDAAGRPFGCFLREDDVTKSTVEFSGGSTMLTGGGELIFDVKYDPDTQLSTATIDMSKSSALYPESVAAAKTNRDVVNTSLGDLTGLYNVSCEPDAEKGLTCEQIGKTLPTSVYLAHFSVNDRNKIAIWESQTKHDQCVPASASDANPRFGFGLSAATTDFLEFDYRGDPELKASMETVWGKLSSAAVGTPQAQLKNAIITRVAQMDGWRITQCSQRTDKFQASNCRFVPTYYNVYSYWDPQKGANVTNKNPMWFSKFCEGSETPEQNNCAPADYQGSVKTKATACTEYWTRDMPMCPAGTAVDDAGKGSFTGYYGSINGEDIPLRLACKGSTENWVSYQDEAKADNKASAITAASDSLGCDVIVSGSFTGYKELEKQSVINSLVELSLFPVYNNASNICRNRSLPASFKFSDCPETPPAPDWGAMWDPNNANYGNDQSTVIFCHEMNSRYSQLNLKIDRLPTSATFGKLIRDTAQTDSIEQWQAREFCPAANATYESSNRGTTAQTAFNTACMSEMTGLSLSAQLSAGMRTQIGMWNTIPYVACGDTTGTTRTNMQAGMNLACLPQANMSMMCDTTKCVSKLRCDGTDKGKCYSNNEFMGRIAGRLAVMDLKESVNKAFEASTTVVDQFPFWNPTGTPKNAPDTAKGTGAMELCTMVNSTSLNGRAEDRALDGYFKNRIKRKCEAMPEGFVATGGKGSTATGKTGDPQGSGLPEFDILMKVKFTKP